MSIFVRVLTRSIRSIASSRSDFLSALFSIAVDVKYFNGSRPIRPSRTVFDRFQFAKGLFGFCRRLDKGSVKQRHFGMLYHIRALRTCDRITYIYCPCIPGERLYSFLFIRTQFDGKRRETEVKNLILLYGYLNNFFETDRVFATKPLRSVIFE